MRDGVVRGVDLEQERRTRGGGCACVHLHQLILLGSLIRVFAAFEGADRDGDALSGEQGAVLRGELERSPDQILLVRPENGAVLRPDFHVGQRAPFEKRIAGLRNRCERLRVLRDKIVREEGRECDVHGFGRELAGFVQGNLRGIVIDQPDGDELQDTEDDDRPEDRQDDAARQTATPTRAVSRFFSKVGNLP